MGDGGRLSEYKVNLVRFLQVLTIFLLEMWTYRLCDSISPYEQRLLENTIQTNKASSKIEIALKGDVIPIQFWNQKR